MELRLQSGDCLRLAGMIDVHPDESERTFLAPPGGVFVVMVLGVEPMNGQVMLDPNLVLQKLGWKRPPAPSSGIQIPYDPGKVRLTNE